MNNPHRALALSALGAAQAFIIQGDYKSAVAMLRAAIRHLGE